MWADSSSHPPPKAPKFQPALKALTQSKAREKLQLAVWHHVTVCMPPHISHSGKKDHPSIVSSPCPRERNFHTMTSKTSKSAACETTSVSPEIVLFDQSQSPASSHDSEQGKDKVVTDRLLLCDSPCARPRFTFWWPLVNLCELPLSDHPSRKTRLYNDLKKLAKVQDVKLPLLSHKLHCLIKVKHLHEGPNALFSLRCYWELCSLVACNREANKLHFTSSCKELRA